MGYFIRQRVHEWALVRTHYNGSACATHIIPRPEYPQHSFSSFMSFDEAKEHARQLNRQIRRNKGLQRQQRIQTRLVSENQEEIKHLPPTLCDAFLSELDSRPDPKSLHSIWRAARKLIKSTGIPPEEWRRRSQSIYNYFEHKRLSLDYAKKIVRVMNMWGEFYSAKTQTPYLHLVTPTGFAAGRIRHAYRKVHDKSKASDGLTLQTLARVKETLAPEHYNWLFVSLWFGLRPSELENIRKGEEYAYFSHDPSTGVDLLNVKQTKLSNLAEEDQWKSIPLLYPEQHKASEIVMQGTMTGPLPKTIKRGTLGHHHRYAGRKGFGPLMWERGHDVVEVSSWLGHKSIDRTYRDYMNWSKLKLRITSIPAPKQSPSFKTVLCK